MSNQNSGEGIHITTAIAVDKDKNSPHAVRWAIDNHLKKNSSIFLVHVKTQLSQPQDAVAKEGRAPTDTEMQHIFLPYRGFCARKGIRATEMVLTENDVTTGLVDFVVRNSISTLIVGGSNRSALTRAFRNPDVPTSLGKIAPDFCSVHAISKGRVQNVKTATRSVTPVTSVSSKPPTQSGYSSDSSSSSFSQSSWKSGSDKTSFDKTSSDSSSYTNKSNDYNVVHPLDRHSGSKSPFPPSVSNLNYMVRTKGMGSPNLSFDSSEFSVLSSFQSADFSMDNSDPSLTSGTSNTNSYTTSHVGEEIENEMKRLKQELKQTMEMYNSAYNESVNAKQKVREIDEWKSTEARMIAQKKRSEEEALALIEMEKRKCRAAMEAAQKAQRLAELETQKRITAERLAEYEAEEMRKAMDALNRCGVRYRTYAIEEIEVATNRFSVSAKIGEGGYGPVFKGYLDHTAVAIKVLRPDIAQGKEQFQKEIEVLSCMRHPNMVLLLGACPEYGCLVYEYMENGSLEDRLFRKQNTPPISWRTRFKIAAEIGTALLFLHQSKPEPLVHRDLKPANILLDRNYVSKISDVGLARMVPPSVADSVTQYHMTAAAGTFCYIDPEYQQTGMLGTKSDLYSLGVMLLQLITGKPPMGITGQVSSAIEKGDISQVLDPTVPDWPVKEATAFANLCLKCCELRRKDRPDLATVILPELERLREVACENQDEYSE
ncbi:U-box domain-containing protein 52-like [Heracleum sosnowskyi]|uniref:RING-type E3 ubiquitin transferase n=1 Tax=Heracleum sosnowskyi TaxID=360622 RepID=A0AAD8M6T3_9APIA|nr:U-box domain-containing protein 52-like [Heracleum sosnowskyi]